MPQARPTWLSRLVARQRRYFAVDGGAAAHFLAALASYDARLQPVASPRHADLLLVAAPITQKLMPALTELARALPAPAKIVIIDMHAAQQAGRHGHARLEGLAALDGQTVEPAPAAVRRAVFDQQAYVELPLERDQDAAETTVALPGKRERELETELAVLSLGPVQPFTAGPLRVLLVCDGEQVLRAETESGYAWRGIAEAMAQSDWRQAALLAGQLDPLAPLAGQLAYLRALEQLQGRHTPPGVEHWREIGLAIERAQNHLWWLLRLAMLLAVPWLSDRAGRLAHNLSALSESLWEQPLADWPAREAGGLNTDRARAAAAGLYRLAEEASALRQQIEQDRLLRLRTAGIGSLPADRLLAAGVRGPMLQASQHGAGDVQSRLLRRVELVATELRRAAEGSAAPEVGGQHEPVWRAPEGQAEGAAEGPRGALKVCLESDGGTGPDRVVWQRPSAAVLGILPQLLTGQKLADAEVILASLDLAMAEADG